MALPSAINPARTSQTLSVVSSSNSNIVRVPSIEILDETGGSLQVLNPGAPPPPVVVVASSKPDQHTKALQDLNDKKNSNQYDDMKDSTDNIHEAAKLRFFAKKALKQDVDQTNYWSSLARVDKKEGRFRRAATAFVRKLDEKDCYFYGLEMLTRIKNEKAEQMAEKYANRRASSAALSLFNQERRQTLSGSSIQLSTVNESTPLGTFVSIARRTSQSGSALGLNVSQIDILAAKSARSNSITSSDSSSSLARSRGGSYTAPQHFGRRSSRGGGGGGHRQSISPAFPKEKRPSFMDRRQINGPTGLSNDKRPSLMIDRGSETSLSPSLGDRRSNFMDRRASIGQHQPQHQHKGSIGDSQSTLSGRRSSLSPSSAFITGVELSGSSNQLNTSCEQLEESLHTSSHEQLLTDKFKGNAFFRIARLIGLSSHLLKYLGSVLKNPIEWGWEYDYFYTNMHMLTRGGEYSSTRTKQFAGSLIPQIRIILQKRPRERTELDISTVQQWAAPMKAFRKYTPELQRALIRKARYEKWGIGRWIVRQGHKAMNVYVILDGSAVVYLSDQGAQSAKLRSSEMAKGTNRAYLKMLGTLNSGDSFGELAIKSGGMRSASIQTNISTEFLLIDNEEFDHALSNSAADNEIAHKRLESLHSMFPLLKSLKIEANTMSRFFDFRVVPANTVIVKEGQYEDCIWFVRSGSCRVLKLMRFAKVPILVGGSGYHLQPIMSDAQMLQRERNRKLLNGLGFDESKSRRNSIMVQVTSADGDVEEKKKHQMTTGPLDNIAKENILTKLLIVRELFAGDFFGEHPNSLINATDMREKSMSTDGKVITSTPSNVSVISNNRCELVGIARIDFHRFSTDNTSKVLKNLKEKVYCPTVDDISQEFLDRLVWEHHKKGVLKEVIVHGSSVT